MMYFLRLQESSFAIRGGERDVSFDKITIQDTNRKNELWILTGNLSEYNIFNNKIEKVENNIDLITIKNDELEVVVSNYGCTLVKVLMKDQAGNVDDVVLGYDDFKSYQTLDAYIGALVGRVANRIKKGTFG